MIEITTGETMSAELRSEIEKLSVEALAEMEAFIAHMMAKKKSTAVHVAYDDISAQELMKVADASGSFDWLASPDEDRYSINEGVPVEW